MRLVASERRGSKNHRRLIALVQYRLGKKTAYCHCATQNSFIVASPKHCQLARFF